MEYKVVKAVAVDGVVYDEGCVIEMAEELAKQSVEDGRLIEVTEAPVKAPAEEPEAPAEEPEAAASEAPHELDARMAGVNPDEIEKAEEE